MKSKLLRHADLFFSSLSTDEIITEREKRNMDFMTAIKTCFSKYTTFSGRARRSEYWNFALFCVLVSTALGIIFPDQELVSSLFSLITFMPNLAVSWRRMHDIGKAGAWSFIVLIPIVGGILFLIWTCRNSEPGSNEYGENPKGV